MRSLPFRCMAGRIQAELFNDQFILKCWQAELSKIRLNFIINALAGKVKTTQTKLFQSYEGRGVN